MPLSYLVYKGYNKNKTLSLCHNSNCWLDGTNNILQHKTFGKITGYLRSLVVRALERYSKDPGSSPGGDTCFSH